MTDFGMKATLLSALHIYDAASRRSGRTETLLRSLPTDNPVTLVVSTDREAQRLQRILYDRATTEKRKSNVRVMVNGPQLREKARDSQVFFDHSALRDMYFRAIHRVVEEVSWITGSPINFPDDPTPPAAVQWRKDF